LVASQFAEKMMSIRHLLSNGSKPRKSMGRTGTMPDEVFAVGLDIGGTSVKSGVVKNDGALLPESVCIDAVDAEASADEILASFTAALSRVLEFARRRSLDVQGVGVGICGPFDYEKGISQIKDLDKYESLYGVNVKQALRSRSQLSPDLPLLFDNDAASFARGEVWVGAGRPYRRVIVFTMGTGVGSAFAVDGSIVIEGPGVSQLPSLTLADYKDSVLNDYISSIYMVKRYRAFTGRESSVKEMAEQARHGDAYARQVFEEIGTTLGLFLREHHVETFGAQCLIFGGRISKSFELFAGAVERALDGITCLEAILPAADIEYSGVVGAAKLAFDNVGTGEK
jgi:glucokinase